MKVKVLNIIDEKTFKAESTTLKKHHKYGKYVSVYKKYLVHSDQVKVNIGQVVEIINCRPISKMKKWSIKSVN